MEELCWEGCDVDVAFPHVDGAAIESEKSPVMEVDEEIIPTLDKLWVLPDHARASMELVNDSTDGPITKEIEEESIPVFNILAPVTTPSSSVSEEEMLPGPLCL